MRKTLETIEDVAKWCEVWLKTSKDFWLGYEPIIEIAGHDCIWFLFKDNLDSFVSRDIPFSFLLQLHQELNDNLNFHIIFRKDNKAWGLSFDYKRFAKFE